MTFTRITPHSELTDVVDLVQQMVDFLAVTPLQLELDEDVLLLRSPIKPIRLRDTQRELVKRVQEIAAILNRQ